MCPKIRYVINLDLKLGYTNRCLRIVLKVMMSKNEIKTNKNGINWLIEILIQYQTIFIML